MDANSVMILLIDDHLVAYSDDHAKLLRELDNLPNLVKDSMLVDIETRGEVHRTLTDIRVFESTIVGQSYIEIVPAHRYVNKRKNPHPEINQVKRV